MGFWGWLTDKASDAADWAKDKVSSGKEWIKEKVNAGREFVSNQWGKISGKNTFDEAERLYRQIKGEYETKRRSFENQSGICINNIENYVESVNDSKRKIKQELFPQMADLMKKIKDVNIIAEFPIEEYIGMTYSFDNVRTEAALYKIDFNKHKFKSNALAVITAGFLTRKRAKETLYAVQEEERKVKNEIAKMDAELKRLELIEKSLQNVDGYFKSLIGLYEAMLVRFDGAVNFLYLKCISFAHKLIDAKLSIKLLPKVQQKEIEAIVTMSKILKQMTETRILSIENKDEVSNYSKQMKTKCDEITKVYEAA